MSFIKRTYINHFKTNMMFHGNGYIVQIHVQFYLHIHQGYDRRSRLDKFHYVCINKPWVI